jgi:hypothetical protein
VGKARPAHVSKGSIKSRLGSGIDFTRVKHRVTFKLGKKSTNDGVAYLTGILNRLMYGVFDKAEKYRILRSTKRSEIPSDFNPEDLHRLDVVDVQMALSRLNEGYGGNLFGDMSKTTGYFQRGKYDELAKGKTGETRVLKKLQDKKRLLKVQTEQIEKEEAKIKKLKKKGVEVDQTNLDEELEEKGILPASKGQYVRLKKGRIVEDDDIEDEEGDL